MTGLDPDRDSILEIALLATDDALNIVAEGPVLAIRHSKDVLDAMDDWNREHHGASGLTQRALDSNVSMADAEKACLDFIKQHSAERGSPLCGNSIWQDRRFIARYMPKVDAFLHYRVIDVSTVKELVSRWYPNGEKPPTKKHAHLALDDIRESIEELRFYQSKYFIPS